MNAHSQGLAASLPLASLLTAKAQGELALQGLTGCSKKTFLVGKTSQTKGEVGNAILKTKGKSMQHIYRCQLTVVA